MATRRTDVTLVAEDFVKTKQALEYTNIITCVTHRNERETFERFRVVVKRDSYEFQSYARVEVWRRDGWTTVHALHGQDARVADLPTYHYFEGAAEQFGDLATALLDIATEVVA